MTFDFSHLYKTETVDVDGLFKVVIREIPHGEVANMQQRMFGEFRMASSKREFERQLEQRTMNPTEFVEAKNILAIESWTLKDKDGKEVPVSREAWDALPHRITECIEEVINRLNPSIDDDMKSES